MADVYKEKPSSAATDYENAFRNFEQYHCGAGAIPPGTFNGTDNYQAYVWNGFSELVQTDNFKIDGQPIKGFRKGTTPKAGPSGQILYNGSGTITIYRDSSNNLKINDKTWTLAEQQAITGNDAGITCLGILLIGAGGTGGKSTQYNYHKKEKQGTYRTPGTGGGGGGCVWGVIKLTRADLKFYVATGYGKTGRGNKGGNSYLKFGDADASAYITGKGDESGVLAIAYGGNGGSTGNKDTYVAGGTGGIGEYINNDAAKQYFICTGGQTGGSAAGYYYNEEDATVASSPAFNLSIAFLNDESDNGAFTTTYTQPTLYSIGNKDDWTGIRLPGGNSWGMGYNPQIHKYNTAGRGGGGAGSTSSDYEASQVGGDGYCIIYY